VMPGSAFTMPDARRWQITGLVALLAMAAPLLPWFMARSTSPEAFTGLLLLALGVALALRPAATADASSGLSSALLAGGGGVAVLAGVAVDVRLLQAGGVAMVTAALWPVLWRRTPPWASLVLVGLGLPLAGDIDVVGFPLRRLSAELAALALPVLGVPVAFAETVLVTEHGLADVEAPCAGLSTLRILLAAVALIAALRGARVGALVAASVVAVAVAVVGNASRVTILSFLVLGARWPDLATLLHVPLWVLVFLAAASAAVPLLGSSRAPATPVGPSTTAVGRAAVIVAVLTALGAGGLRAARPTVSPADEAALSPPTSASASDLDVPLSVAEQELYGRHALAARKRRLQDAQGRDVGEVLVVLTRGLRAIHAPERCLAGNGHAVVDSAVVTRAGLPVKRLVLDGGRFVGLSLLRSARGRVATDLGDVALARLGIGTGERDDGPWVFVSAVVATDRVAVVDEDALVASLVDDATFFSTSGPLP
jgi:exosortase O